MGTERLHMTEDQRLWQSVQNGNPEALRRLYQQFKDGLLTAATMMLHDRASAEDCLHDVFVTLAAEAQRIQIRRNLKAYLTTCVVNRARDYLRKKERRNVSLEDLAVPPAGRDDTAAGRTDPAEVLVEKEESAKLLLALGQLPVEQREVITLHLRTDMTFKEIAATKEISINTAQSRYRYGIDKLRKLLNEEDVPK
jgi:RNA polymerase sigma-70 factor (ECF subfamily)